MRRLFLTGAAALLAAALAACSSSPSSSSPSGSGSSGSGNGPTGTLTISNEQGTQWNCSFNPFNPGNLGEGVTMGQVYEPLMFVDTLENAKVTPWLASGLSSDSTSGRRSSSPQYGQYCGAARSLTASPLPG